ncbi:hypothetical protein [Seonamhaeicola marinus]|uniref:Uncharacterized protein n=1 Tax=Seonamhaeicola marinus TaxID=1912246 RepID=A0A5D0HND8_9FLAO|nr:hypothetical protein [Seonamhaeicola marinus]TYA71889.1 hypothetical protein FUA24_20275 [Seonamhaeicola marinus]
MENKQQSERKISKFQDNTDRKSLVLGSVVATLIAITPYLFYLHESVPNVKSWDTFFGLYESNYYESVFVLAWTLTSKLIPLFLLFVWIFTCKHWWYHTLLVPIAMYFYQIIVVLNDDLSFADSNQMLYLIPVMAIVIPTIYLVRARIFNRINEANKSMEELEEELMISPKNFWGKVKDYF